MRGVKPWGMCIILLTGVLVGPISAQVLSPAEQAEGFVSLFNGQDLSGWNIEGTKEAWSVQNGLITCDGRGSGWLRSDWEYEDFILRLEWRISPGGNSGVFFRCARGGAPWTTGHEVQILDDAGKVDLHGSGSLYGNVKPSANPTKGAGEWNAYEIRCQGKHITVIVNGTLVVEVNQEEVPALKEKPLRGYIGLQNHGSKVEFRNLRIKEIGYRPLFNGRDLTGWKVEGAGEWSVEDGMIFFSGRGRDLWTTEEFTDFVLRVEWKIKPGGDSGIYLRGSSKSQVNIWENPVGSGEIHGYRVNPTKRMDRPPGEWNLFEITVRGNKVSVWFNGEVVIKEAELVGMPPKGPLALQSHGHPIWFRNIRIKVLKSQ